MAPVVREKFRTLKERLIVQNMKGRDAITDKISTSENSLIQKR
jgi:hypothetical protein